jgi:hypothetical protein
MDILGGLLTLNGNHKHHDDDDISSQKKKNDELKKKLETIRRRRRKIHNLQQDVTQHQTSLAEKYNQLSHRRHELVEEYSNTLLCRESHATYLDYAQRWNVINDCFHIWINGAFATINGCRLGSDSPLVPSTLLIDRRQPQQQPQQQNPVKHHFEPKSNDIHHQQQQQQQQDGHTNNPCGTHESLTAAFTTPPSSPRRHLSQQNRRYFGLFVGNSNDPNSTLTNDASMMSSPNKPPSENPRVPWLEVNAALGHACLLLKLLQELSIQKGGRSLKFTHELYPVAATSKIGIRFVNTTGLSLGFGSSIEPTTTTTPVVYNLYFEESTGFNYFFKNNIKQFNLALQAFVQCIAEASAQQTDKTIAVPYPIEHVTPKNKPASININPQNFLNGGEWMIGGIPVCYPSSPQVAGDHNKNINVHGNNDNTDINSNTSTTPSTLEWTRACKYLLTDLKWLVAYSAKHVDR